MPKPHKPNTDYPDGDGNPDCPHCSGRGAVPIPDDQRDPLDIGEILHTCVCVHERDLLDNIERGWKGLSIAPPIKTKNPLVVVSLKNAWVTAEMNVFKMYLKDLGMRKTSRWFFNVITDIQLMDAWLSNKVQVKDPEVSVYRNRNRVEHFDVLADLVQPPDLLIIRVGVKVTRNVATPEALLESIQARDHLNKPTWIVDNPVIPFNDSHIAYDERVGAYLSPWDRVQIGKKRTAVPVQGGGVQRMSLADFQEADEPAGAVETTSLLTLEDADREPKKGAFKKPWRGKGGKK